MYIYTLTYQALGLYCRGFGAALGLWKPVDMEASEGERDAKKKAPLEIASFFFPKRKMLVCELRWI
jgi:hypothetical protein